MSEENEGIMTSDDKVLRAKEFFGRGNRNFLVKDYSEAAEDLSRACELYAEIYGENADELGLPHLLYAKTLIRLAQNGENKVLAIQDEEAGDDDDDDDDDEGAEVANDEGNGENKIAETENGDLADNLETGPLTTTNSESTSLAAGSSNDISVEPQPGPSSGQTNSTSTNGNGTSIENADIPEEEEDDSTNLQYAWEALEIAVKIFERMGESGLPNLADAYFELAEISLENDHCADAVKDYERSCEIYLKLPDNNLRVVAETKYKIGLCYYMLNKFDEAIAALKDSSEYLNGIVEAEKRNEQTKKTEELIQDIEATRQEIALKITEVQEAKDQSLDIVRQTIAKLMPPPPSASSNDGSGSSRSATGDSSSSSSVKANDISHLIKRKKPDVPSESNEDGASLAKKPSLES